MPALSIIVPVYNKEQYLNESIKSILNQTFTDFELILVNDGSTDSSLAICRNYQELDNRVHVIDQPNAGVSAARNTGIAFSTGTFIGFIDSDDTIEADMYQLLLSNALAHNADISACLMQVVYPKKTIKPAEDLSTIIIDHDDALCSFFKGDLEESANNKIYKSEKVKHIKFEGSINEDILYNCKAFLVSDTTVLSNTIKYNYLIRDNSTSMSGFNLKYFETTDVSAKMLNLVSEKSHTCVSQAKTFDVVTNISVLNLILLAGKKHYLTYYHQTVNRLKSYSSFIKNSPTVKRKHKYAYLLFSLSSWLYTWVMYVVCVITQADVIKRTAQVAVAPNINDPKSKASWIDNVKVIAISAIITLHASAAGVIDFPKPASNNTWWIANFYDSFCRFGTPAFLMVTGALLLRQNIGLKEFLKRRLNRILVPFAFWWSIYLAFGLALNIRNIGYEATIHNFLPWAKEQILQGPAVHLWYVYMIISLYLFIPIIKPWVQTASNKAIMYFLSLWLITLAVNQQQFFLLSTPFDLKYFSGYIGYLVLGYFISERLIISLTMRKMAILLFFTGFIITLVGTYLLSSARGTFANDFYNRLTVNVLMSASGAFIIMRSLKSNLENLALIRIRNIISRYGFGIYLNHILILDILSFFKINYKFINPVIGIPLSSILCLIISCLVIYILNKLPYGKSVSGSI